MAFVGLFKVDLVDPQINFFNLWQPLMALQAFLTLFSTCHKITTNLAADLGPVLA
jgi:hypothetical protein